MRVYTTSFKLKVIQAVLAGEPKESVRLRHNIKGKSAILNWMRKLGVSDMVSLPLIELRMIEKEPLSPLEQQKKIKQLERALEDEKLRVEAYRRIIEKAEQELNISIRKKPNTK